MTEAYMKWSYDSAHGTTHEAGLSGSNDAYSFTVVDVFGMWIFILSYFPSHLNSAESRTATFNVIPVDAYICAAFVRQGVIPTSPIRPTVGFSIHTLELFRVAHLRCPQLSQQAYVKTLSDLHSVQHQKYLTRQFSIAFDIYLSILGAVDNHVKTALGRDTGDWRLRHACPACMYKLKEELGLLFGQWTGTIPSNE
jgi:hypothetical protein